MSSFIYSGKVCSSSASAIKKPLQVFGRESCCLAYFLDLNKMSSINDAHTLGEGGARNDVDKNGQGEGVVSSKGRRCFLRGEGILLSFSPENEGTKRNKCIMGFLSKDFYFPILCTSLVVL